MNSKGNKRIISAIVAIAIIFTLLAAVLLLIAFDNTGVFAKESKNIWNSNSNVTWSAGTVTTNSSSTQTITLNSKMQTNDDFNIKFKINSNNFSELTLSFVSPANVESSSPNEVTNTVTLSKNDDGKIDVLVNDQDEKSPTTLTQSFATGTEIEFKLEKGSENKSNFTINGTKINDNKKYSFYLDLITKFSITMGEIDSTASIQMLQLCGKDISGTFTDNDVPVCIVDGALVPNFLIADSWFTLPVYYFDLFDNNFYNKNSNNTTGRSVVDLVVMRYETEDAAEGTELPSSDIKVVTSSQTLSFRVENGYWYDAIVKLNDGAGNITEKSLGRIKSMAGDEVAPTFGTVEFKDIETDKAVNTFVELGEEINFARPEVTDTIEGQIQNPNRIRVFIQYKKASSNEWSPSVDTMKQTATVNNLTFKPSELDATYELRFAAVDEKGNIAYSDETFTITRVQDMKDPVIKIKDFPEKGYLNDTLNLPSMTVEDKNSSITREIKVYKGTEINEENLVQLSGNSFLPEQLGTYTVIYTARDSAGNEASETKTLEIVPLSEKPITTASNGLSAFEIVMICIASVCALEIVYLLIPRKKGKKSSKK